MPVTNFRTLNGRMRGQTTASIRTDYLTDALGSVTATATVTASATIENTYRHKPYGGQLSKTGTGTDPRFLWTGDTGSRTTGPSNAEQYNRARHYGNRSATWTSLDPLWPKESPYGYVRGNPGTGTDPSGLERCPDFVYQIQSDLIGQLFQYSNTKRDSKIIDDCIQKAARKGNVKCSPYTFSTGRCLVDHFPLVECIYDPRGVCDNNYGRTPAAPRSLVAAMSRIYTVQLCMETRDSQGRLFMCPSSNTNYFPQLHRRTSQTIWVTLLHEALHACAFHHGEDLAHPGHEPTADRTCNEIASCCIHRHISGKPLSGCSKHLPPFSTLRPVSRGRER
ncbi:hypothetical protein EON81_03900 [bacterium]|nr:MAG: hypothetical protein EON81_03900 [bacterium]